MMINLLKQYGLVCLNNCQVFINIVITYLPTLIVYHTTNNNFLVFIHHFTYVALLMFQSISSKRIASSKCIDNVSFKLFNCNKSCQFR